MNKAYIQAAILGFVAVLLIDAFLVFSFMQPLFGFMVGAESLLYVDIIFGSMFGMGIQYAKEQLPYKKGESKKISDLRHVLILLVLTIITTYVVVFGSYLPIFPLVLYSLYHLVMGTFYSSMPSKNQNTSSLVHDIGQLISAPLLGGLITMIFCIVLNTVFLVSSPLSGSLILSGVIGAVTQSIITFFLMDFNAVVSTQWIISFSLLSVCLVALCLSTTPYLPIFICMATPTAYFLFRRNTLEDDDSLDHDLDQSDNSSVSSNSMLGKVPGKGNGFNINHKSALFDGSGNLRINPESGQEFNI